MQARTCLPLPAPVLILASILACSSPSDQGQQDRTAWDRGIGLIDNGGGIDLDPLVVAEPVRAGKPFIVTVITFGSTGCIRPDRSQVEKTEFAVDITPFDSMWAGVPPCLPGWEGFPRSVQLTFADPGQAVIRLHGRGFNEDLTLEKTVTVQP